MCRDSWAKPHQWPEWFCYISNSSGGRAFDVSSAARLRLRGQGCDICLRSWDIETGTWSRYFVAMVLPMSLLRTAQNQPMLPGSSFFWSGQSQVSHPALGVPTPWKVSFPPGLVIHVAQGNIHKPGSVLTSKTCRYLIWTAIRMFRWFSLCPLSIRVCGQ